MLEPAPTEAGVHRPLTAGELVVLFSPLFTVALGYGAALPILPNILERVHWAGAQGATALHAGLLTGIYVGAFVITAPLWGKETDLRGPRAVLLVGWGRPSATKTRFPTWVKPRGRPASGCCSARRPQRHSPSWRH